MARSVECFLEKSFKFLLKRGLLKINSTAVSFVSFLSCYLSFLFEAGLQTDFHQFPSETHFLFRIMKFTRNRANFPTTGCCALDPMVTGPGRCACKTGENSSTGLVQHGTGKWPDKMRWKWSQYFLLLLKSRPLKHDQE